MTTPQRNQTGSVKITFDIHKDKRTFNEHPEWLELLEKAFASYTEVKVHNRLAGYSIAQTWRVSVDPKSYYVVKFGPPTRLAQEYKNFKGKVSGNKLYGNPVTPEGPFAPDDKPLTSDNGQWAILKWTLAGGGHSQTLLEHIKSNYKEIGDYIGDILTHIFNMDGRLKNPDLLKVTYAIHYDRLLPEHFSFEGQIITGEAPNAIILTAGNIARDDIPDLEAKLLTDRRPLVRLENFHVEKVRSDEVMLYSEPPAGVDSPRIRVRYKLAPEQKISSDQPAFLFAMHPQSRNEILANCAHEVLNKRKAKEKSFDYQGINYANPLIYLQDLLGEEDKLQDELKFATIHGDLNLQNILVARVNNQVQHWLIDFADTDQGPMLLDFQWLEVQVIIWLLAPEIRNAQLSPAILLTIFQKLHECHEMPEHLNGQMSTPYAILRQIRLRVRGYLSAPDQWAEYYRGLILALLGSLRFRRSVPGLDDYAPRVAFLSAAILTRFRGVVPQEAESLPVNLAPTIDESSLPTSILPGTHLVLNGSACGTGATVQILINERPLNNGTKVDGRRTWQAKISFDKAGSYTIIARDDISATESKPVMIKVADPVYIKPKIDALSTEPILLDQVLSLSGDARPNATLKVFVNEKSKLEIVTDEVGYWHTEIPSFAQAGHYTIYVVDAAGLASDPISISIIVPPTIDETSLPAQLFARSKFFLRGTAQPGTTVQLFANQQSLPHDDTKADSAGHWETKIILTKAGTCDLFVRDKNNEVNSAPVSVMVSKSAIMAKSMVISALIAALFLAITTSWYFWHAQTPPPTPTQPAVMPTPPQPKGASIATCDPQLPKIKIGVAINGSGRYLIFGQDQIIGYQIGFKYTNDHGGINGRCIEPVYKDLESSTDITDTAKLKADIQYLVDSDIVAIIAPGLSQQVVMISDTLKTITTPMLGPSTTKLDIICNNPYFSRISAPGAWYNNQAITAAANELRLNNKNNNRLKVVVAYADNDAFTRAESDKFKQLVKENPKDLELLPEEFTFQTEASDSNNQLQKLARKIIEAQPDIIIISGLTNDGGNLIKALRTSTPDQKGFRRIQKFNYPFARMESVPNSEKPPQRLDNYFLEYALQAP